MQQIRNKKYSNSLYTFHTKQILLYSDDLSEPNTNAIQIQISLDRSYCMAKAIARIFI